MPQRTEEVTDVPVWAKLESWSEQPLKLQFRGSVFLMGTLLLNKSLSLSCVSAFQSKRAPRDVPPMRACKSQELKSCFWNPSNIWADHKLLPEKEEKQKSQLHLHKKVPDKNTKKNSCDCNQTIRSLFSSYLAVPWSPAEAPGRSRSRTGAAAPSSPRRRAPQLSRTISRCCCPGYSVLTWYLPSSR